MARRLNYSYLCGPYNETGIIRQFDIISNAKQFGYLFQQINQQLEMTLQRDWKRGCRCIQYIESFIHSEYNFMLMRCVLGMRGVCMVRRISEV